jgi:hypothetical protein
MAGIAAKLARPLATDSTDTSAQYSAGLWHSDLPHQLLWKRARWSSEPLSYRLTSCRAPRWSWASTDAHVEYPGRLWPALQVLGGHVTLENEELLHGEVTFALLAVLGRVKQATLVKGGTRVKDLTISGYEDLDIASVEFGRLRSRY